MGYRVFFALVVALALAACVRSKAMACGDLLCPEDRACVAGACVDPLLVTACARLGDGDPCTVAELGGGVCQGEVCHLGVCGNGVIDGIDACDGDDLGGKTCLDFGSTDESGLACAPDCSFDKSKCVARCGDGVKNTTEQCDGKDFGGVTCFTQGFYAGELTCTDACEINAGACNESCGDGMKNGLEQCDGVDFGGITCAMRGFAGQVSAQLCDPSCGLDPSSCLCGVEHCANTEQCVQSGDAFTCEAK